MFELGNDGKDKVYNTSTGYKFPKTYAVMTCQVEGAEIGCGGLALVRQIWNLMTSSVR